MRRSEQNVMLRSDTRFIVNATPDNRGYPEFIEAVMQCSVDDDDSERIIDFFDPACDFIGA